MKQSILEKLITFLGFSKDKGSNDGFQQFSTHISREEELIREMKSWSAFYNLLSDKSRKYFLAQVLGQPVQDKQKMMEVVEAYKDTFFHQMIVNLLVDDALSVDPVSGDVVALSTVNEYLKPVVDGLQERIDLDAFISSIIEDVVAYGDYIVRVVHDGKRVVALEDDIDQKKAVVVYKAGKPVCLIDHSELTKNSDSGMLDYTEFVHFSVNPRKIRLKLPENIYARTDSIEFTEYVRVGKPLFWGLWDLLNSLYILMVFYPVFCVQKLNASTVVGIKVPAETSMQRAWEVARKYQELLNVYTTVDERGRVALVDVIDTVGKYKVVPVWGDEKGFIQLNEPRFDESYALDIVDELKVTLCASLGVPYSFLFGSREGATKLDTLKGFSRYVKKVASIQRAVREGLYQLVRIEARLQGFGDVAVEDIDVRFRNALISTEHLDKLEFVAGMIETVRGAVDAVNEIASALDGSVDKDKITEFLNEYLGLIGLDGAIKVDKVQGEEVNKPVEDVDVGDWMEEEEEGMEETEFGSGEEEFPFEAGVESEEEEFPFEVEPGGERA
ncbi:MAG: hypothetical protein JHC26_08490 [Thermofilum sp.]|jgi:hypothetical protein|uniref:hypothetical protein n=1 Tax=Thermofilum sp. TaxID=1961369 RepID=UPI00258F8F35|nr:hypothetical protein [Thermofilum sp.]MCI4409114.1 hypothetical protein [Thermofilum sp.]